MGFWFICSILLFLPINYQSDALSPVFPAWTRTRAKPCVADAGSGPAWHEWLGAAIVIGEFSE